MSPAEPTPTTPETDPTETARERWFLVVLLGLFVAIAGFTVAALQNSTYPCEPHAGSTTAPPLADCAVALAPGGAVFIAGVVLTAAGYLKVR